jgi:hypothetical protein
LTKSERKRHGSSLFSADIKSVTSPERSSNTSSPIYDHEDEAEVNSVDLRRLLAAPGWHIDPPSTATRLRRYEPVPVVQDEDLDGFEGDNWIPPPVPEGEEVVAVVTAAPPRSKQGRKIVTTVATLVGIAVGLGFSIPDAKRPSLASAASPAAEASAAAPVKVAPDDPVEIDANTVVMAAQRLKTTATAGVRIDNATTRSADGRVLDYVFAITPESVKVGTPDASRGASNTHVTATSTAANVAALRLDNPAAAKEALDMAINGEYQLDLWFNRAGNLIRLTVYTADTANGGRIEVAFAEPVSVAPVVVPAIDEPFVGDNAPSETIPEPPTTVAETTTEAPTTQAPTAAEAPTTTQAATPETTVAAVPVATTKAP